MIFPAINLHLYIGGFPLQRLMRPDGISVIALASISVSISGGSFRTQWRQPICRCESDSNSFYRIIFYLCVYVSLSFQFILDRKPTPKLSSGRITLLTYPRCNWRLEFVLFLYILYIRFVFTCSIHLRCFKPQSWLSCSANSAFFAA